MRAVISQGNLRYARVELAPSGAFNVPNLHGKRLTNSRRFMRIRHTMVSRNEDPSILMMTGATKFSYHARNGRRLDEANQSQNPILLRTSSSDHGMAPP
jgi:hypothetical protein